MEELLKRRAHISRLYDVYHPLLTERQKKIYELHEIEDLSLSEISEELQISRQAVSDQLAKAREKLEETEKLLMVVSKLDKIQEALNYLDSASPDSTEKAQKTLRDVLSGL